MVNPSPDTPPSSSGATDKNDDNRGDNEMPPKLQGRDSERNRWGNTSRRRERTTMTAHLPPLLQERPEKQTRLIGHNSNDATPGVALMPQDREDKSAMATMRKQTGNASFATRGSIASTKEEDTQPM
eukprot:CAMPEP_0195544050 /NCGR_PEP_ID=MMETSP0794_2-20130614/52434_1 /TAXON_ID=515487 /ORGANISM="Stephanopyxis turris, Strain CCMP 815" /LENGTH=126 /DNA_ID=CAMNT_0040678227 /DNA_START=94 /DNA_END=475 /DNA_ORIENTATION=+